MTWPLWAWGHGALSALHARLVGPQLGEDQLTLTARSSQCSVSCGVGVRRRSVTCRGDEGSLLHATACSSEDRPLLTEPCVHDDCPPLSDQAWHVGAWGLVSTPLPPPLPHCPVLVPGSDYRTQASSPSPCLMGTPQPEGLSPHAVCSLLHSVPGVLSAPRAAARALGGARWSVPLGPPAAVGACSCPSPQPWRPATRSPAISLQVRMEGAPGAWPGL